ncbi:hypothetical protein H671_8g19413 [Cricetulus griseus]|uniref:Uncharacterized protein n=1 Tax=Cricetulus griseus TaxID=10029 RepID=A0A061I276_CRIGR|nr:hypothetical protein H671_8g19413 [Cricetulus griseus]
MLAQQQFANQVISPTHKSNSVYRAQAPAPRVLPAGPPLSSSANQAISEKKVQHQKAFLMSDAVATGFYDSSGRSYNKIISLCLPDSLLYLAGTL